MTAIAGIGRTVGRSLGRAVYPPVCAGCGAESGDPSTLCPDCWRGLHFLAGPGCEACGRDMVGVGPGEAIRCDDCLDHPPAWRRGAAVFAYESTGRRLVLALKHGDRLDTLPMLAGWLLRRARPLVGEAELIVPVPLHWSRRLRRRYNQAAEVGRALARAAGRPGMIETGALRRLRATPSQGGRSRAERAANLDGALAVPAGAQTRIAGRHVLLVDDVMTTGATLNVAARALLAAGAASVDMVVLALVSGSARSYLVPLSAGAEGEE